MRGNQQTKARKRRAKKTNMVSRLARVGYKSVTKGGMAYKAFRLAKRVADAVNIEYKLYDAAINTAPTWSGTVGILNGIAQGTSDSQRIGDSLKCQRLSGRLIWDPANFFQAGVNIQSCAVRLIIYWDEQNNVTSAADVLQQTGNVYTVISPKNYDTRFRSRVLYDKTVFFSQNLASGASYAMNYPHDDIDIELNAHTQYDAASTTINTGALKYLLISDNVASTYIPSCRAYLRLTYTDN